jgi:multimeric flavodoxin WrbA
MNILVFSDVDSNSPLSTDLKQKLVESIIPQAEKSLFAEVGKNNIFPCAGCLICFTKNNGVCVKTDMMSDINSQISDYDTLFYIGPMVFGQFTAPVKNAQDKGQTINILRRGITPSIFVIGYGDDITLEEKETFIDIIKKHRGEANIVHPLFQERAAVYTTSSIAENDEVIRMIKEKIAKWKLS